MAAPVDPRAHYAASFSALGVQLEPTDGCPEEEISAAERRLGLRAPAAIRDYFLLAGREARINQAHNHLLSPSEWFVDSGQLVFLAENQNVVLWGFPVADVRDDPAVLQGVNGDEIAWHPEHPSLSEFLTVMIHWQAVMGAFGRTWSAVVDSEFPRRLDLWRYAGEVNGLCAYSRDAVALCWLRWDDEWRIFAASMKEDCVEALGRALSLAWDRDFE